MCCNVLTIYYLKLLEKLLGLNRLERALNFEDLLGKDMTLFGWFSTFLQNPFAF
jgi:hypothetical protein